MPWSLNETLYNVGVVQTQLDTMINNTAVSTESLPPDGVVLQYVISEVLPCSGCSHARGVVQEHLWGQQRNVGERCGSQQEHHQDISHSA